MTSPGFSAVTSSEHPPDRASAPRKSQTGQKPSGTSSGRFAPHSAHCRVVGIGGSCWRQHAFTQYRGKQKRRLRVKKDFKRAAWKHGERPVPVSLDYTIIPVARHRLSTLIK